MRLRDALKALKRSKEDHSIRLATLDEIRMRLSESKLTTFRSIEILRKKIEFLEKHMVEHGDIAMKIPKICSICGKVWDDHYTKKPCLCKFTPWVV